MFPAIRKSIGPNLKALDLRFGAVVRRNTAFFHDARHPRAAGLRPHGNHRHLHDGRSAHVAPGHVGPAIPGIEMTRRRERRNSRSRAEYFSRLLAAPRRNRESSRGRLVSHRRPGRSGRERQLARYRTAEKSDRSEFRPQRGARTAGGKARAALPEAQQVVLVGNQRSFLAALVTATAERLTRRAHSIRSRRAQRGSAALQTNSRVSDCSASRSLENGLLTTMGKLKRDAISARFAAEIEELYQKKPA